jgi:NAD-dependent SIR2 family protein deacetylase
MNNSTTLAEIQSKYQNCNLLIPAATSVQINPFYKCTVMEVVPDTSDNSGDIFKVGNTKVGEDRNGKAVYVDVFSLANPDALHGDASNSGATRG